MARPQKDGLDYFPFDVDFLQDKKVKLIKAEFGAVGVLILVAILSDIYRDNGYYKRWDKDDCLLMSEGIGCGCSPETVSEVVKGCVRRSLFDEGVANAFGVLTSSGIQRRYLKAVSERINIQMCEEYLLIDLDNPKDISVGIRKKLNLISLNPPKNKVNQQNNEVNLPINPQSKVKKSKEYIGDSAEPPESDYEILFEKVWLRYPNKKGKNRVSTKSKKNLVKIGEEHITRCIERYMADLKKDDWRKPQYGSTFFNGGYVDYLDANYEPCIRDTEEMEVKYLD